MIKKRLNSTRISLSCGDQIAKSGQSRTDSQYPENPQKRRLSMQYQVQPVFGAIGLFGSVGWAGIGRWFRNAIFGIVRGSRHAIERHLA